MASVVVCAAPRSLKQAGLFAAKVLGGAELRSFEDIRRRVTAEPILVYLTHPDYDHLRSLLGILKPGSPNVVIYYAGRLAPSEAAQLGRLVGELRPKHTSVVFEAKAAASMLGHVQSSASRHRAKAPADPTRKLRNCFGLTQTELAEALGISLRTVQNWEHNGQAARPRHLRDLAELWSVLKDSFRKSDIPAWLRSANDAFAGKRPIDLVVEGKARDIIVEFRRLQSGEPV
jgi:DNA-binding transcriptional regulator YiaG